MTVRNMGFKRRLHSVWFLVAVAILSSVVGSSSFQMAAAAELDLNQRRKVVLVAGICSENPAISMSEIYQWLQEDLAYDQEDIVLFDYRDTTPLLLAIERYEKTDTLISIDGPEGSAANLRGMIDGLASSGDGVDIIAHSQGGVVSLFAALDFAGQSGPPVRDKIHTIVTINSPVQGVSLDRVLASPIFTDCANATSPSVLDMYPHDPADPHEVIERITAENWSVAETPYVLTIANTNDPVISEALLGGERGVLEMTHDQLLQDLGGTPVTAHSRTLDVISNSMAQPIKDKLVLLLIEQQIPTLFLKSETALVSQLAHADVSPTALTLAFVGKVDSALAMSLLGAPIYPEGLSSVFVGKDDARLEANLLPPSLEPLEGIPVHAGWNLISYFTNECYYDTATPPDVPMLDGVSCTHVSSMGDVFSSMIEGEYEVIRSFDEDGGHTYDPDLPMFSDLHYVAPGYGYWVLMAEPGVLTLPSSRVDALAGLSLQEGWNLVGVWPADTCWYDSVNAPNVPVPSDVASFVQVADVGEVFASIGGQYDVIRSFDEDGGHTYDPDLPMFSDLHYVCPGYGYWLLMNQPGVLSYPLAP